MYLEEKTLQSSEVILETANIKGNLLVEVPTTAVVNEVVEGRVQCIRLPKINTRMAVFKSTHVLS